MIKHISIIVLNVFMFGNSVFAGDRVKIDSLLTIIDQSSDNLEISDAYETLIIEYQHHPDSALRSARQFLNFAKSTEDPELMVLAQYYVSGHYFNTNHDSMLYYMEQYKIQALKTNNNLWIMDAYDFLAYIHSMLSNFSKSLDYYKDVLELAEKEKDSTYIVSSYINIGYNLSFSNEQYKSLQYMLQGLKLAEAVNDSTGISDASHNIACTYDLIKSYQKAYEYFKKSLDVSLSMKNIDSSYVSLSYSSLAGNSLKIGQEAKFNDYMSKSKDWIPLTIPDYELSNLYCEFAENYLDLELIDSASYYIDKAINLLRENTFDMTDAYVLNLQGTLASLKGDQRASINYLKKSLDIYQQEKSVSSFYEIIYDIAKEYSKLNEYDKAYYWMSKANAHRDSLHLGSVEGALTEFEQQRMHEIEMQRNKLQMELEKQQLENSNLKYKTRLRVTIGGLIILSFIAAMLTLIFRLIHRQNKKLNNQNELIKTQISQLEQKEKQLTELNNTKDKFFSIIAHDLKNPFSSIINISGLFFNQQINLDKEKIQKLIGSMHKTANYGFSLLENLLEWARSQTGRIEPVFEEMSIKDLVDSLIASFAEMTSNKHIKFVFESEANPTVYADKNMVHTILRNLMHNAVKFSHEHGVIEIKINREGEFLKTCVTDHGIGMTQNEANNLFRLDQPIKKPGTFQEKGTGLGLILCKEFIEKNNGTISVSCEKDKGCTFCFQLPCHSCND